MPSMEAPYLAKISRQRARTTFSVVSGVAVAVGAVVGVGVGVDAGVGVCVGVGVDAGVSVCVGKMVLGCD